MLILLMKREAFLLRLLGRCGQRCFDRLFLDSRLSELELKHCIVILSGVLTQTGSSQACVWAVDPFAADFSPSASAKVMRVRRRHDARKWRFIFDLEPWIFLIRWTACLSSSTHGLHLNIKADDYEIKSALSMHPKVKDRLKSFWSEARLFLYGLITGLTAVELEWTAAYLANNRETTALALLSHLLELIYKPNTSWIMSRYCKCSALWVVRTQW